MTDTLIDPSHYEQARELKAYDSADAALQALACLYAEQSEAVRRRFEHFRRGDSLTALSDFAAVYPYLGVTVPPEKLRVEGLLSYGQPRAPGSYGVTVTQPDLFRDYLLEQINLLIGNHDVPVLVGLSKRPLPLPFVVTEARDDINPQKAEALAQKFHMPDLAYIDDKIANGSRGGQSRPAPGPLALFSGERVDYSLARLRHYTGTEPAQFQKFVLFTNYQRYVDEFIETARDFIADPASGFGAFVEPGPMVHLGANPPTGLKGGGKAAVKLPQMPAYHLIREDGLGITLVNIGVGPSNAKTITDHIAVLRPHCWLMLGHCAGLRRSQRLGDYVLAHGYVRDDHVLDRDLPVWVPVPPIAEVQVALTQAVAEITGLKGREAKTRMRTGTVATTDDRNWELHYNELFLRLNQSRAIAVDMESATLAANGFRFRVPYGTLLCVSDKPMHGELKLPGMADRFYRERIGQHLKIGLRTMALLREQGPQQLHSRKLRSLDEPAFR